jgi:hypothetical protein
MHRRALLASLGAFGTGLAGCLGDAPDTGASPTDEPTVEPTATDSATPEPVTEPETPASVPDLGVPPAESDCPVFDRDDTDRVVCTAAAGDAPEPMALVPSADSVATPRGTVSFTLRNDTDVRFDTNLYAWKVWKRVDDDWYHVAPRYWNVPLMFLDPGQSHEWTLTVDNTDLDGRLPHAGGTSEVTVAGLGGGAYAFGTDGWFQSADHERKTAFVARFEVEGPRLDLRPTEEVTATTRDGDTVTVRTAVEASEETRRCEFRVTRRAADEGRDEGDGTDEGGGVRERITEQLLRDRRLRNTLPFFESGVETVRLVEPNGTYPPFGVGESFVVAYERDRYAVRAREL